VLKEQLKLGGLHRYLGRYAYHFAFNSAAAGRCAPA
jgi:hypothetical protein